MDVTGTNTDVILICDQGWTDSDGNGRYKVEITLTDGSGTITHDGAVYRMKITRQGKLILNK